MAERRWYSDPAEPGAPGIGDIVVALNPPWSWTGVLWGALDRRDGRPWLVRPGGCVADYRVGAVRWPTEPEIALYQLDPAAAGSVKNLK